MMFSFSGHLLHSGAGGWGQFHPTQGGSDSSEGRFPEEGPGAAPREWGRKAGQGRADLDGPRVSFPCCYNKLLQNDLKQHKCIILQSGGRKS